MLRQKLREALDRLLAVSSIIRTRAIPLREAIDGLMQPEEPAACA
jgi:hypothetical protein